MTMAPRYLLDAKILSDIVRNPWGSVALHIHRVGEKFATAQQRRGPQDSPNG